MKKIYLFGLSIIIVCGLTSFINKKTIHLNTQTSKSDSLMIENYKNEIKNEFIINADLLSRREVDSLFLLDHNSFSNCQVAYSPDNSFKIFTIEVSNCGNYCVPIWFSWIHYNLKEKEKVEKIYCTTIDTIYQLNEQEYLILFHSWGRPSASITLNCSMVNHISISNDSLRIHPIKYNNESNFGFCQEFDVDLESFISYDTSRKIISYQYGIKSNYESGIDFDTIKKGKLKYKDGNFILKKERVTVKKTKKLINNN